MIKITFHNRKKNSSIYICMQCTIWLLAICTMIFTFCKKLTPVYIQETLNSVHPINTPELHPGEFVSQTFTASHENLYDVSIAISYQDTLPEDTSLLIQILSGENLIVEQSLSIWYCPNSGFCNLLTDLKGCQGETITVRVENTSPVSEDATFSLLATNKNYLYLDNTNNYLLNGKEQDARLLLNSSYLTGYSYYNALTYCFWILFIAMAVSYLISKRYSVIQEHSLYT